MKTFLILILLFLVACSTGEERLEAIKSLNTGKVIYQQNPFIIGRYDMFIVQRPDNNLTIFWIDSRGTIYDKDTIVLKKKVKDAEIEY